MSTASTIPEDLRRPLLYRLDPVAWVEDHLGNALTDYQAEILRAVAEHDDVSVASCHGVGKDWTASRAALWFVRTYYPATVVCTAPTSRQLTKILWKELKLAHRRALRPMGGKVVDSPQPEIKWDEDWRIWGFTAPDYDSNKVQGIHEENILVIVDEAAGVSRTVFNGLDGLLTSTGAKILRIGNPTDPTGEFADSFKRASVHKISISAFQTPNFVAFGITEEDIASGAWAEKVDGRPMPWPMLVTPKWAAEKYEKWGPKSPLYIARVLGKFPEGAPDSLIQIGWIDRCEKRKPKQKVPVQLALDVARYGDDDSVLALRTGDHCRIYNSWSGANTMATTGRAAKAMEETGAECIKVDVVGIGAGVADRLAELGYDVIEMGAGEKADDDETYGNKRAEWMGGLAAKLEHAKVSLDHDVELREQLVNIKRDYDSKGRMVLESKKKAKARGVPSPDRADAVAMAMSDDGVMNVEVL